MPWSDPTRATGERFGYGFVAAGLPAPARSAVEYHLAAMRAVLGAPQFTGRVLDAGCGEGIDLVSLALAAPVKVIGVELSSGGVRATRARTAGVPNVHLVRGDVLALPLRDGVLDGAYSYGVVHHTMDPALAVREIARVLKPGAPLLVYVYEDFSTRSWAWRALLLGVNVVRQAVSHLSPLNIRRFCALIAPLVYLACTWPSKRFRFAARFPYPASQNPTVRSLIPDLYDRFAAPIEKRYSERGARELVEQAGCTVHKTAFLKGWVVWGERSPRRPG